MAQSCALPVNHRAVALVFESQAVKPVGTPPGPSHLFLLSLIMVWGGGEGCELSHEHAAVILREPAMGLTRELPKEPAMDYAIGTFIGLHVQKRI
jgi:hypothetical protein